MLRSSGLKTMAALSEVPVSLSKAFSLKKDVHDAAEIHSQE
jgi:hypothetical protein